MRLRSAERCRRHRSSLTTSGIVSALVLIGACLVCAPTTQALTTVNAIAPADGATLPLDQPTTFVIQQTAGCSSAWWLYGSYRPDTDANGVLVDRLPLGIITSSAWTPDSSGYCEATWDPRILSYSVLPPAGSTVYWQAWRNTGEVTPVQSLQVSAGTRVPPPSPDEVGLTVNDGAIYTNDPNVKLTVAAPEFATRSLIANDGGFAGAKAFSIPESDRATYDWKLVSSGSERLPKTVYARFSRSATEPTPICSAGPALATPVGTTTSICGIDPTKTFSDDIILDQTAPIIDQAQLREGASGGTARAVASSLSTYHLRLQAHDKTSGVDRMQITNSKAHPGRLLKFRRRIAFRRTGSKIFVRVRDRAGNFSRWRRAQTFTATAR